MIRHLFTWVLIGLVGAWFGPPSAHAAVAVPPRGGYVVDTAGALPAQDTANLEGLLRDLEARKGAQVVVVVIPTTDGEPIEQFALRVAEAWKPGRQRIDDGAVMVVATADRTVRIEVGYGLEGALPDAIANRIIGEVMVPRFRAGDLAGGIQAGVEKMVSVIDGEPLPVPARTRHGPIDGDALPPYVPLLAMVALVMAAILPAILGRLGGSVATGGVVGAVAWWLGGLSLALSAGLLAALFTLGGGLGLLAALAGGRRSGRGYGGYGGGFGGGGGFHGGGGGFGGGGASGRW